MDPNQYLFDALSQLTGGLITDLRTLFLGGIVVVFLLIGFDHLKDAFFHMLDARAHDRFLGEARDILEERDQYQRGSAEWDSANYMYRELIGKASRARIRSWGE